MEDEAGRVPAPPWRPGGRARLLAYQKSLGRTPGKDGSEEMTFRELTAQSLTATVDMIMIPVVGTLNTKDTVNNP